MLNNGIENDTDTNTNEIVTDVIENLEQFTEDEWKLIKQFFQGSFNYFNEIDTPQLPNSKTNDIVKLDLTAENNITDENISELVKIILQKTGLSRATIESASYVIEDVCSLSHVKLNGKLKDVLILLRIAKATFLRSFKLLSYIYKYPKRGSLIPFIITTSFLNIMTGNIENLHEYNKLVKELKFTVLANDPYVLVFCFCYVNAPTNEQIKELYEEVSNAANSVGKTVSKTATAVGQSINSAASVVKEKATNVAYDAREKASQAATAIGNAAINVKDSAEKAAKNAQSQFLNSSANQSLTSSLLFSMIVIILYLI